MPTEQFKRGDKVTYVPQRGVPENGIVKTVTASYVFVVYRCDNQWDNFDRYTAAATNPKDLIHGWHQADIRATA